MDSEQLHGGRELGRYGSSAADRLQITGGTDAGRVRVALTGELDDETAVLLTAWLAAAVPAARAGAVVLDLSGVTFCDSMGLRAIILVWKRLHGAGGSLTAVGMAGQVRDLLDRTGLAGHITADHQSGAGLTAAS
ncbi:STAS domain-containing protein [Actinomadura parmotrematis]|uniref:Anti-sigma factor antagonist n=1 Tax=Actinomadura parmotrematis TaxID=2864039 RepID=A0ABS7FV09_9ACTN|nr:STAS domain-containing protein [Actinomadura parmotrematis]MBW8483795.1 STAS domain-containing protein [Actinomadura parmotrematis]